MVVFSFLYSVKHGVLDLSGTRLMPLLESIASGVPN
jgi:hypothetical protein